MCQYLDEMFLVPGPGTFPLARVRSLEKASPLACAGVTPWFAISGGLKVRAIIAIGAIASSRSEKWGSFSDGSITGS